MGEAVRGGGAGGLRLPLSVVIGLKALCKMKP